MKIGIVIGRFPPDTLGGAELQAKQLAGQLAKRGHETVVFTRRYHQRPYREKTAEGYTMQRHNEVPIPGLRMVWDTIGGVWDIARYQPRPDVLLCYQTLNSGQIGFYAQKLTKIPIVVSVRGNREYRFQGFRLGEIMVPRIYREAKRIAVQSERIKKDMSEQLQLADHEALYREIAPKINVIPNGITLPDLEPSQGDKVIFVGRLIQNKGIPDLIAAIKKLPGTEAIIVGDGPERENLEALAQGLPIQFTGRVPPEEVYSYLGQARVLVLPSHLGDGFPNVIIEAMACGVPVVATGIAGIPDLVRHEETGFLFEVGDIEQLTAYIAQLFKDEAVWQKLSQQSLEVVQTYSWDVVIPQVEQLLRSVIHHS